MKGLTLELFMFCGVMAISGVAILAVTGLPSRAFSA
jgi:hypothetical protein